MTNASITRKLFWLERPQKHYADQVRHPGGGHGVAVYKSQAYDVLAAAVFAAVLGGLNFRQYRMAVPLRCV